MRLMSQEECRNVQMDILDDVAAICKEHNLQYYLAFGSLLGASAIKVIFLGMTILIFA